MFKKYKKNNYNEYSDSELITVLKENGSSANEVFNIIYSKYTPQVYGFCKFKTNCIDDADEALNDTWIEFINQVKAGKKINNILNYMFGITRNIIVNKYIKEQANKKIDIEYFDSDIIDQNMNLNGFRNGDEETDILKMIKIAVESLENEYKEVALLHWFSNTSISEIASICEETDAVIRRKLAKAIQIIDEMIKKYIVK